MHFTRLHTLSKQRLHALRLGSTKTDLSSPTKEYHGHGNKYISSSRRCFDVYVFVLKSNSFTKKFTHMCIRIYFKINSCEKREVCVSNSESMVLGLFYVCVCALSSYSTPKAKECACIFSCENGIKLVQGSFVFFGVFHQQIINQWLPTTMFSSIQKQMNNCQVLGLFMYKMCPIEQLLRLTYPLASKAGKTNRTELANAFIDPRS